MKKWLVTSLFVVCGICLYTGGWASTARTGKAGTISIANQSTTVKAVRFKEVILSSADRGAATGDIVFRHPVLRVLYSEISWFTIDPNFYFSISCSALRVAASEKTIGRVGKDHLLHLFPSHYFW